MVALNLWELITRAAGDSEHSHQEQAAELRKLVGEAGGFGNELTLKVSPCGIWIIRVFPCDGEAEQFVELRITRDGRLQVTRKRALATNVSQTNTLVME